jgi:hypothetical protein
MSDVNLTENITAAWIADVLRHIAVAARADYELAAATREAIFASGLFDIFGAGELFNPVDVLDVGGEDALRAQLARLDLTGLRALIRAQGYDPNRETARWRSVARFIELVVEKTKIQLDQERKTEAPTKSLSEAHWLL